MNYCGANIINFILIKSIHKVQTAEFQHVPTVIEEARGSLSVPRVLQACPSTLTRLIAPCGLK